MEPNVMIQFLDGPFGGSIAEMANLGMAAWMEDTRIWRLAQKYRGQVVDCRILVLYKIKQATPPGEG